MEYAIPAFIFGLTGGIKPGPLSVYVIHITLTKGEKAGLLASFAPFVSDGPIILLSLLVLSQGKQFDIFIAGLSLAGCAYLLFIALKIFLNDTEPTKKNDAVPASFLTAVKLNLINPAPYLFWGTVGGAYLVQANIKNAGIFIVVMLTTLAITKFGVAKSIKIMGDSFNNRFYTYLLKVLALLLIGFAMKLGFDGYEILQNKF
jgi:threonine/homoserine/homoserine lactone efflux protein